MSSGNFERIIDDEYRIIIYGFESSAELFTLKDTASKATISREFLKRYKILKPGAVKRLRKEGIIRTAQLV